jgi:hypothetical protein
MEMLSQARDRAAAVLLLLQQEQASLAKLSGESADEGRASYAAAVDAAGRTLDNLQRVMRHGE